MIKFILKRDGRKQKYNRNKIAMAVWQSLWAVSQVRQKFPSLIDIDEIARRAAEIEVPRQKAEKQSSRWKEAERLAKIVEDTLIRSDRPRRQTGGSHLWNVEEIQDVAEQALLAAGRRNAARAYILYRNRQAAVRSKRSPSADSEGGDPSVLGMSDNAFSAMAKRYLRKDKNGNIIETPRQAMKRVAGAVSAKSKANEKFWRDKYLKIMSTLEFVPAGCYFRGAGNKQNGSLANCFVLPVEDSIEEIFQAVGWAARIHQLGGGVGYNFSRLRPRGDVVKSGGLASGPINFMKAFDAETQIVMQGGTHRGANMGILNVDHPDIFEFIRAKSIDGEVSNFNISIGVSDKFMRAVKKNGDEDLINPRDQKIVKTIPARSLWGQIINLAHTAGDPGLIFLDTINKYNPLIKKWRIEATNVCGEQPLYPFDVCNLGSINLSKFVIQPFWKILENINSPSSVIPAPACNNYVVNMAGRQAGIYKNNLNKFRMSRRAGFRNEEDIQKNINWSRLEEVIRTAVRFLDDGVDASTYPIPRIEEMAHKLRRIGLGVMGWADMLAKLGIPYNSDEGTKLAKLIMKFIQNISWDESEKLAEEKAEFPLWKESYFNSKNNLFGKIRKVRNVAVTTIAPTGTISMIADCSSGIEPYFALEYTKNVVEKQGLKYTNKYYEEALQKVGPSGSGRSDLNKIFPTAHDISPDWHVRMQAAFQKYTDNAVSKTINFSRSATVKDIEKAYFLAWKSGCKGITVYRDGSRAGQILQAVESLASPRGQTLLSSKLAQSQLQVTPLSQRAYQIERARIAESASDGHCPECGGLLESTEGCELCRQCGHSRCGV